jgi:hypothetical protein
VHELRVELPTLEEYFHQLTEGDAEAAAAGEDVGDVEEVPA